MVDSNGAPGVCSICERSMLPGERTRTFVTRDRDQREVCDLCVVRAESAGWTPAGLVDSQPPVPDSESRGRVRRLFGRGRNASAARLRPRPEVIERGGESRPGPPAAEVPIRAPQAERDEEAPPRRREQGEEEGTGQRRRSIPQNPDRRIRRAFESFNASQHRRTVGGLIRSLGSPHVSAVTTTETPAEVRITVAWELSWYQWEIDLAADGWPVRELGKGAELDELEEADRDWNARAATDGELQLGLEEAATA